MLGEVLFLEAVCVIENAYPGECGPRVGLYLNYCMVFVITVCYLEEKCQRHNLLFLLRFQLPNKQNILNFSLKTMTSKKQTKYSIFI